MERVAGNVSGADFLRDHRCSASLCRDLFFGTDHYGTGRSEKSGCSTQSGTALTRNRELVGTDLPLF